MEKQNNTRKRFAESDKVIGRNIRIYRLAAGLSQAELGDRLGVTFQQIQKYENGANRVAASTLPAASDVLGVSIPDFFRGLLSDTQPFDTDLFSRDNVEFLVLYEKLTPELRSSLMYLLRDIITSPHDKLAADRMQSGSRGA